MISPPCAPLGDRKVKWDQCILAVVSSRTDHLSNLILYIFIQNIHRVFVYFVFLIELFFALQCISILSVFLKFDFV